MSKKIYKVTHYLLTFVFLCALSVITRYPFFGHLVVEWDESTFILMGQDILNGHVLYTHLWDIKSPLSFYIYALFLHIAGQDIEIFRLLGALYLGGSSFILYLCVKRVLPQSYALLCSALCLLTASAMFEQQAVLTEHLALLPLLLILQAYPDNRRFSLKLCAYIGFLLAVAVHIRLNLAFVAVGVCLLMLSYSKNKVDLLYYIKLCAVITTAFLVTSFFISVPHIVSGDLNLYLDTVFFAALDYSNSKSSMIWVLGSQAKHALLQLLNFSSVISPLTYLLTLFSFYAFYKGRLRIRESNSAFYVWALVLFIAVELSIMKSGRAGYLYMVQIVPFLCLFSCVALRYIGESIFGAKKLKYDPVLPVAACLVICTIIFNFYRVSETPNTEETRTVAYLSPLEEHETIYAMDKHIIYWLLDRSPVRPSVTHPSNLTKEFILKHIPGAKLSSADELQEIKASAPTYIIKYDEPWYLVQNPDLESLVNNWINTDYILVFKEGALGTYKLRQ